MNNGDSIVPGLGEEKWADSYPGSSEPFYGSSGSWVSDMTPEDRADIAPKADVGSLERYKNEIDGEISQLDSRIAELEKRRDALTEKLKGMARYSTDREIAANRLEAGEGAGEYEAMRGRMISDATKEQQEAKAASDKAKVDDIEKQYKIAGAIDALSTDAKNLKDARTLVAAQNNSTTPAEKENNASAAQFYKDQLNNDIKKARLAGLGEDEIAMYETLMNASEQKTPASVSTEKSAAGSNTPSGNSTLTLETIKAAIAESEANVHEGDPEKKQVNERDRLTALIDSVNDKNSGMSDDAKYTATNLINKRIGEIKGYKTKEGIAAAAAAGKEQAAAEKEQAAADIANWKAARGNPRNYTSMKLKLDTFRKSKQGKNASKYYDIYIDADGNFNAVEK